MRYATCIPCQEPLFFDLEEEKLHCEFCGEHTSFKELDWNASVAIEYRCRFHHKFNEEEPWVIVTAHTFEEAVILFALQTNPSTLSLPAEVEVAWLSGEGHTRLMVDFVNDEYVLVPKRKKLLRKRPAKEGASHGRS